MCSHYNKGSEKELSTSFFGRKRKKSRRIILKQSAKIKGIIVNILLSFYGRSQFISIFRTFSFKFPTIVRSVGFFLISLPLLSFEREPRKFLFRKFGWKEEKNSRSFAFKKHLRFNPID